MAEDCGKEGTEAPTTCGIGKSKSRKMVRTSFMQIDTKQNASWSQGLEIDSASQTAAYKVIEFLEQEEQNSFQIFLKTPEGESTVFWIQASDRVPQLKQNIMNRLGYPYQPQNLI